MNLKEETLKYHLGGRASLQPSKPLSTSYDLSLAYSPGMAEPYLETAKDESLAYTYTDKTDLVAIISDSSAVPGLGSIGASTSKPVMEGEARLFRKFASIDASDLKINAHSIGEIVAFCRTLASSVGGISLEDISAPKCFVVEATLQKLGIPVMHDNQHGTAIISTARLVSAMEINNKSFKNIKVVISGAGAAEIVNAKMYRNLGIENIILIDSKGIISKDRADLGIEKLEFARNTKEETLKDAMCGTDVSLGLSKPNIIDEEMLKSMTQNPAIFTLANPVPEVMPELIHQVCKGAIVGTGRSDYANQINNVLDFPSIFRGASDVRISKITENVKATAARALTDLAKLPVSEEVKRAYAITHLEFSENYAIPKPFDVKVKAPVSTAVARATIDDGVAKIKRFDEKAYFKGLQ